MIKEMFVSSTPHETKVAITEDDQLAEIFFERENEYTLAGSIYKGRVTRVLPGMQSAFVDIGLERDAFLYVSDFLDLGTMDEDEELDDVPVSGIPPQNFVSSQPQQEPKQFDFLKSPAQQQQADFDTSEEDFEGEEGEIAGDNGRESTEAQASGDAGRDFRGGRRRRRGRRGRDGRFDRPPEQRPGVDQRPAAFEPRAELRPFEPVDAAEGEGSEPIVLPGESLSKYQRRSGGSERPDRFDSPRADRDHARERAEESIATVADVPAEHTHEPVPVIDVRGEDAHPQSGAPEPFVLPGESLRKYRRNEAEPQQSAPAPEQPPVSIAHTEAVIHHAHTPKTLIEHPLPTPGEVVSSFMLPGESLRKYQKTEHSQPDSPVSEGATLAETSDNAAASEEHRRAETSIEAAAEAHNTTIAEAVAENSAAADSVTAADGPVSVLPVVTATETTLADVAVQPTETAPVETAPEPRSRRKKNNDDEPPTEAAVRMDTRSQVAPFVLPGENLRKYTRKRTKNAPAVEEPVAQEEMAPQPTTNDILGQANETEAAAHGTSAEAPAVGKNDADVERLDHMNVASVFAGEAADSDTTSTATEQNASAVDAHQARAAEEPQADHHEGHVSSLASLPANDAGSTELADARPQFTEDEQTIHDIVEYVPERGHGGHEHTHIDYVHEAERAHEAAHQRYERPSFEPTPAGTVEHEEIDSDDIPDDEHEFRSVNAIGTEEDALFEELEETTLAPQAAEALNDERGEGDQPFVIEGGYEFDHAEHGAGVEEPDEDLLEDEQEEAEHDDHHVAPTTGTPAYRRGFDRRRGRRGGREERPNRGGRPMGGRPPRRDVQRQNIQISDLLKEGQEVLIQIAKEPIGKKGARITSHIALPGRFLVYMPTVNHIGVSRKINSEEERQRLKRIMISEREGGHGGFIVRTAAAGITEEELRADIRFLKNLWNEIRTRAENAKPPALIYHDLNLVERVLRDQVTSDVANIWVDTEQEYERILRFANRFQPSIVRKVKLYTKETPLYEQFGIQEEINKGLRSKVWLKSGGYIVINQTEALVAIDINTGKYVGKTTRLEDTIVKTNIDAIREIVRQIRLRDLGGIIVIDFIDMDERKNRQKVMQALEEALKADRAPSKVLQFNDFGLVAITRKRVKQSLERTLGQPCPYCTGNGFVKSVTTVCNEIYIEARKLARQLDKDSVILRVNPEVGKALKVNSAKMVNEIEEAIGRTIIVKPDPLLHTEQFDFN